jgi:hypothetical protein
LFFKDGPIGNNQPMHPLTNFNPTGNINRTEINQNLSENQALLCQTTNSASNLPYPISESSKMPMSTGKYVSI